MSGVLLGFEHRTGRRIEIPLGHMVCTGQTQESGKTTALEAVISRSNCKAIAFVTKRGESSFQVSRKIKPYFAEPTEDAEHPLWMWVKGILEANQQRKMVFEESHIIKACRSPRLAHSLDDVHQNVQALLHGESHNETKRKKTKVVWDRRPVRGISESIYTQLDAYFAIVLPQLARLPYSKTLDLHKGVNVMDLSEYATQTQALVMRSVLEWVYRNEKNTIVIIPEAWEFVPQGKNSPVRMAAEIFIRKAAAMKNFLWIDSQDTAGVEKLLLRNIKVWLFGVQREKNECDRVLDSIPDLKPKPKRLELQTLEKGHFYVCWEREIVHVYVQPAWMASEAHAQAIARGDLPVASARDILDEFREKQVFTYEEETENVVRANDGAADRARISNQRRENSEVQSNQDRRNQTSEIKVDWEGAEEAVWKEKYEALKTEFDSMKENYDNLVATHDAIAKRLEALEAGKNSPSVANKGKTRGAAEENGRGVHEGAASTQNSGAPLPANVLLAEKPWTIDEIAGEVINQLRVLAKSEPTLLKVLAQYPELQISVQRRVIESNADTLRGLLALMLKEGFFDDPRNGNQAFQEVQRRGRPTAKPNVYRECDGLAQLGFLTKEEGAYKAVPGMKISVVES